MGKIKPPLAGMTDQQDWGPKVTILTYSLFSFCFFYFFVESPCLLCPSCLEVLQFDWKSVWISSVKLFDLFLKQYHIKEIFFKFRFIYLFFWTLISSRFFVIFLSHSLFMYIFLSHFLAPYLFLNSADPVALLDHCTKRITLTGN